MSGKKKDRRNKKMTNREYQRRERKLDFICFILEKLYTHRFVTRKGKPTHRQLVADYLRELPSGTRFYNSNICEATGLTPRQLTVAKRNPYIKLALSVMLYDPNNAALGWVKF